VLRLGLFGVNCEPDSCEGTGHFVDVCDGLIGNIMLFNLDCLMFCVKAVPRLPVCRYVSPFCVKADLRLAVVRVLITI
jgi:hypothetical protein